MEEKRREFYWKIREVIRNQGRNNTVSISEIDEILNEYYEYYV
jgi:hypothetical protein